MSLRRWVSFLDTLEPLRYAGLFDARAAAASPARSRPTTPSRAFDRGLAAASVAERLDATGLDMFDAEAHEKAIRRFTAASRAVREHLTHGAAGRRCWHRGRSTPTSGYGPGRRAAAGAGQAAPRAAACGSCWRSTAS